MNKGPDAFRTISEVADDLDLPQHVLRFWETRFAPIRPLKRGGGRRYYRPDDVELLKGIRHLLYGQGYTIKGVQRILKEDGPRFVQGIGRGEVLSPRYQDEGEAGTFAQAPNGSEPSWEPERAPQPIDDEPPRPTAARMAPSYPEPSAPSFSSSDLDRLKSALDELLECERVLASLRPDDDPGR